MTVRDRAYTSPIYWGHPLGLGNQGPGFQASYISNMLAQFGVRK